MMHRWKGALAALAIGTTVILGAACSEDAESTTPTATTAAASTGTSQSAATAAPTEDPRAGWPEKFTIGLFGGDDAEAMLERQEPFINYMTEALGVEIEAFTGTSYGAVIEAMRADRVDAMVVGPFSYVLAVQEADAEALGINIPCSASVEVCTYNPNAAPFYQSVIITRKGNGVESLDDLRGQSYAFVDAASTSGHLAPKTLLIKNGIDPDAEMETIFAGSHPTAALAVFNGTTVGGGTNEGNLQRLVAEGQLEACLWADGEISKPRTQEEIDETFAACPDGNIAILAVTDPIPSTPFAVRSELPQSFKDAVRDALLAIKDDPALVEQTRYWYEDPTESLGLERLDHFFNSLRDIARLLDLDLKSIEG